MDITPFRVEEWMNAYEEGAKYNIAETCVDSVSLDELFELAGEDKNAFLTSFSSRRLTYGDITGSVALKSGISELYKTASPDLIVPTHGAAGANHHVFCSLISPGDHVISIMPTYQQLYSIPESIGAEVSIMHLKKENGYLPDINELRSLMRKNTRMICINNPNNPTGALIPTALLKEIISIAEENDAYLLCDEVYRHLTQEDIWCESVADLYQKGISVGSMSKVFSLAGLRMGWIFTHDDNALKAFLSLYRDLRYSLSPRFEIELLFSRLASLPDLTSPEILVRKIEDLKNGVAEGSVVIKKKVQRIIESAPAEAVISNEPEKEPEKMEEPQLQQPEQEEEETEAPIPAEDIAEEENRPFSLSDIPAAAEMLSKMGKTVAARYLEAVESISENDDGSYFITLSKPLAYNNLKLAEKDVSKAISSVMGYPVAIKLRLEEKKALTDDDFSDDMKRLKAFLGGKLIKTENAGQNTPEEGKGAGNYESIRNVEADEFDPEQP